MNTFFEYCYIHVIHAWNYVLAFILSMKTLDIALLFSYNFYKYVKDFKTLLYYKPKLCVYINMLHKC